MRRNRPYPHRLTRYEDVDQLLSFYWQQVVAILGENLAGMYLTGSLSYGAFRYDSSDIDITVMVKRPVSRDELDAIQRLHREIEDQFSKWARRLECTYTPVSMLPSITPPKEPRPWYWGGEGVLYEEAPYGNEWIINNYLLYQQGITLHGPEFRDLTGPINIEEVQKACIRDLFKEWEPKKKDDDWFYNSHYASYFVLNLCRILHTVMTQRAGSKKTAAAWVKRRYGEQWKDLVAAAEQWHYGVELNVRDQALVFLEFVVEEVSKTAVYRDLKDEINGIRG